MPDLIDPAEAAWATYSVAKYLDRDTISPAHEAFIAGWRAHEQHEEEDPDGLRRT